MSAVVLLPGESSDRARTELRARPIRLDEYHRMIDTGILDEDERVELLGGVIVEMSPQSKRHALSTQRLTRLLARFLPDHLAVRPQLPLTITLEASEPEPDLAVVTALEAEQSERHPERALLVIEVAADSLQKDRGVKSRLYARAGIPEYWIVNLVDDQVEAYRDPDSTAGRYRRMVTYSRGESAVSEAIEGFSVAVEDVAGR